LTGVMKEYHVLYSVQGLKITRQVQKHRDLTKELKTW
jgi:hypothetical protein